MILALALQQPTILTNNVDKKWEMKAEIPAFLGKDPLSKFAEKVVTKKMTTSFNTFLAETKRDWAETMESQPYSFESSGARQLGDTRVQSYTVSTYRYVGGAHGLGITESLNFALVGGKPKQLSTYDIFTRSKKTALIKLILDEARKDPGTDWLQPEGGKTSLEQPELDNFWVGKDGITWEFNPYQLGSYASGPFSFKFSWKQLKPFLRTPSPLAPLLKP